MFVLDRIRRRISVGTIAATTALSLASAGQADAIPVPGYGGTYHGVTPTRILDTGTGLGGVPLGPVAAHGTVSFTVAGAGSIPTSGVGSVVLDVSAGSATQNGYIVAFPTGAATPATTNLAARPGRTVTQTVVVPLGSGGRVSLYNNSGGTVRLLADTVGYYIAGTSTQPGTYTAVPAARIVDTGTGLGAPQSPVAANSSITVQVAGKGGVPSSGAGSVLVSVSAGSGTQVGSVTAYASGRPRPPTVNVAYDAAETTAAPVLVPLGADGKITLYNKSAGTVRLIIDTQGWFRAGAAAVSGAYQAVSPARILDTTSGVGAPVGSVPANGSRVLQVGGRGGVPGAGADSVLLSLSASGGAGTGYLTAYATGSAVPGATSLSYRPGATSTGLVAVRLGTSGRVTIYNKSSGSVQLTADTQGYTRSFAWSSRPQRIDPGGGTPTGISCPTTTFCVATDDIGNATVYADGTWSRPVLIDPALRDFGGRVTVSCASAAMCVALAVPDFASGTRAYLYSSGSWSGPTTLGVEDAVSCATSTFCVAVGVETRVYDGTSWHAAASPPLAATAVSCPSADVCVAAGHGHSAQFSAMSWKSAKSLPLDEVSSVSCRSSSFCAATGVRDADSSVASLYNGSTWGAATDVGSSALNGPFVSCTSTTHCVSVDDRFGTTRVFDGTSWTDPGWVGLGNSTVGGLSCPTSTTCVAVTADLLSYAARLSGTSWLLTRIDAGGSLDSVSCVSETRCVAVDVTGQLLTYDGTTWSAPKLFASAGRFTSASCTTVSFCMIASDQDKVFRWDGVSLSTSLAGFSAQAVSCVSTVSCVTVGSSGSDNAAAVFDGTGWSAPKVLDPTLQVLTGVSCASATFCVATDWLGQASVYNGSSWSTAKQVLADGVYRSTSVSCPTSGYCVAVGYSDEGDEAFSSAATLVNGTWTRSTPPSGVHAVSCAARAVCVAVGFDSGSYDGARWTPAGIGIRAAAVSCATTNQCVAVGEDSAQRGR